MIKVYDFIRGKEVKIISIAVLLTLVFVLLVLVFDTEDLSLVGRIVNTSILVLVFAIAWGSCPKRMVVTSDNLIIEKNFGRSIVIPRYRIKSVESVEYKQLKLIRTFGNGGLFGYTGRYSSRTLGKIRMLATERDNLVCIKTDSECYVVSCRRREEFVSTVGSMIVKR